MLLTGGSHLEKATSAVVKNLIQIADDIRIVRQTNSPLSTTDEKRP